MHFHKPGCEFPNALYILINTDFLTSRPGYRKIVQGEGVPLVNEPKKRGDLIITFSVEFPKHLPRQSKKLITKALSELSSVRNNTKNKEYTVIMGTKINDTAKK